MNRVPTNVKDVNGNEIYSTDFIKYTYYRCGRVSHTATHPVVWGKDEDGNEGWLSGGYLLSSYGKDDNKKEKETIEIVTGGN